MRKPGSRRARLAATVRSGGRFRRAAAVALALLAAAVHAAGCGGDAPPPEDAATHDPSLLPARTDYRSVCSVCHGRDGAGAANLFPPLRDSPWTTYPPEPMIRVVLHGLEGPLTVDGKEFMNKMAPLANQLDDARIAAVLTYVRTSWGNTGTPVTADEVARVRREFAGRDRAWTVEELEPLLTPQASAGPDS